jgi:hypothetical protein
MFSNSKSASTNIRNNSEASPLGMPLAHLQTENMQPLHHQIVGKGPPGFRHGEDLAPRMHGM